MIFAERIENLDFDKYCLSKEWDDFTDRRNEYNTARQRAIQREENALCCGPLAKKNEDLKARLYWVLAHEAMRRAEAAYLLATK